VVNVTVWGYEAGDDLQLGIRDALVILVEFDTAFDDSAFSACSPALLLNVGASRQAAWVPRADLATLASTSADLLPSASLAFRYVVEYGDSAAPLDFGSSAVSKANALMFAATCTADDNLDLSRLSRFSLTPAYSVSTKPAVPIFLRALKAGSFRTGDRIDIVVDFDTMVQVVDPPELGVARLDRTAQFEQHRSDDGIPGFYPPQVKSEVGSLTRLTLNNGAHAVLVGYYPASSPARKSLLFVNVVEDGDDVPQLDVSWAPGFVIGNRGLFAVPSGISLDDQEAYNASTGRRAVSLTSSANISIATEAQRFPPAGYDPHVTPFPNGPLKSPAAGSQPVRVQVVLDFNAIFDVNDRFQTFRADVTRQQSWLDPRLNSSRLQARTDLSFSQVSSIWLPRLTFDNAREFIRPMDFHCSVFNNGSVVVRERMIHTFSTRMDARRFPFDTQTFAVVVRSVTFDRRSVVFSPLAGGQIDGGDLLPLSDGSWDFTGYTQQTANQSTGLYADWQLLNVLVEGARLATYNVVILVLPIAAICVAQVVTFFFPLKSDARMSVSVTGLIAIITFNFVLVQVSPPVSYMTKMTYLRSGRSSCASST
jgi:hypothetical protein